MWKALMQLLLTLISIFQRTSCEVAPTELSNNQDISYIKTARDVSSTNQQDNVKIYNGLTEFYKVLKDDEGNMPPNATKVGKLTSNVDDVDLEVHKGNETAEIEYEKELHTPHSENEEYMIDHNGKNFVTKKFVTIENRNTKFKSKNDLYSEDSNFEDKRRSKAKHNNGKLSRKNNENDTNDSIIAKIKFPSNYHATGFISLPYDRIAEPFETWYSGRNNLSRVDFYHGMDRTYQRTDLGKYGVYAKIAPAHWAKKGPLTNNKLSCWFREGDKWAPVSAQAIIPLHLDKFELLAEEKLNGVPVYKLRRTIKIINKTNTYQFFVTTSTPHRPVRYEMLGFDHLLQSHYDYYVVDYTLLREWVFDFNVFVIPKDFKCAKDLNKMNSTFDANPMSEFIHNEEFSNKEQVTRRQYNDYKEKHGKMRQDPYENMKTMNIYRHNLRYINWHNRRQTGFILEPNHLADMTDEEFSFHKSKTVQEEDAQVRKEIHAMTQLRVEVNDEPLPKELDWRKYGAVTKVKSQSFCSSCWSFSAVGAVEGAYKLKFGESKELSAQQLIDCSWPYDNNGCRGGWSWRAFQWIKDNGIADTASYGDYLGQEGYCHCDPRDNCTMATNVTFSTVKKGKKDLLKGALAQFGPAAISVHCSPKTFKFYSRGVYNDKKCIRKTNHAVLVVGWGVSKSGEEYWIIKNSWGLFWGDEGYIKINMKNDLCGILNNEPIVVSFDKFAEKKNFPFRSMTKIDYDKEIEGRRFPLPPIGQSTKTLVDELGIDKLGHLRPSLINDNDEDEESGEESWL